MIKLIFQLVFFSSLLFSNVLASSLKDYSAVSSVTNNDSMLKILLVHVEKDPKLRLISKTFMKAFDEFCSEQLLILDPRIKYLTHDEYGHVILSPIGTFMPKSVPLLILYNSYYNLFYPLNKKSFYEKFPVLEIPEDVTADALIKLKKEQNTIDSQRFIEMLSNAIAIGVYKFPFYLKPSEKLHSFYRLLVATFSEYSFIYEIANSIDFPVQKFLYYAASGLLKNSYGAEILSRFSINCRPDLILTAIETGIPDLLRAILNNSQNNISILIDQRTASLFGPIHLAAMMKNVEIINLLLEREFPADVKGNRGIRPIHLAVRYGNYDAVVRLFEFDKDVTSSLLNTLNEPAPIVLAAQKGHFNIVEFFLAQATVDMTNNQATSRRLVEFAVLRKDAKLGQLLIDSGKVKLTSAEIELLRSLK